MAVDPHSVSGFARATSPPFDGGEEASIANAAFPLPVERPSNGGEVASPQGSTEWGSTAHSVHMRLPCPKTGEDQGRAGGIAAKPLRSQDYRIGRSRARYPHP